MKKHFKLIDLDCANCAAKMEAAIKKLDGVNDASVSFLSQKMTIDAEDDKFDEIVKQAEAYQESKINEATGQAARFTELFNEYQKYPLITKQRLFYEAMEDILPDMKLYIVDDATGVQTSLPLESYATVNMGGDAQ